MINVLQFICPSGYFGAERWIVALANNLDKQVVRTDLLVYNAQSDSSDELIDCFSSTGGCAFHVLEKGRIDLIAVSRICKLVRERKIDLIHTHGYKSDIIGWIVARLTGVHCVSTPHGFGCVADRKLRIYNRLDVMVLKKFDCVVPLSKKLRGELLAYGLDGKDMEYIPNGVDLKAIDTKHADDDFLAELDGKKLIGFSGRLIREKNIEDLIGAFSNICDQFPSAHVLIIGNGEHLSVLKALSQSLELEHRIHFLGYKDNALSFVRLLDIFVMTSISEGIPRSMMEAMALNVPVVAYDIPGVDQLITDRKTGLLAPLYDQKQLASLMSLMLTDRELALRLSSAGRRHIEAEFSASSMATLYTSLYQRLTA